MALQILNEIPGVDIQIYTDGRRNEENQSGNGIYINICAKCGVASASAEHILSCLRLSRETFETDPLLALDFLRVPRGVAEKLNLSDLSGCRTNHPTTDMRFPSRLIIGKGQNVIASFQPGRSTATDIGTVRLNPSGLHIFKPYPDRTEAGNESISLATRSSDVVFISRLKRTAIRSKQESSYFSSFSHS
uniref:Uncharacterized protein n=1 Tax=Araneus ventricosus TaxID=182803 RepID=A0A4Y2NB37_ARAVE|nr:hypothetical protein AVEN_229152-1 [Araneus ventricosus]